MKVKQSYNITVVGIGYVGLSNAVLLAEDNNVTLVDVVKEKVDLINMRKSPIADREIETYLREKELNLKATIDGDEAYKSADYVIVATPTDYDAEKNYFNTSTVEAVISRVQVLNPNALILIKSTVPVGFTRNISEKNNWHNIMFGPEFLREGRALYDNLYPSRIIIGRDSDNEKLVNAADII